MKRILATMLLVTLAAPASGSDFKKGEQANYQGDYATALRDSRPSAEQSDARRQYYLGIMYFAGLVGHQDNIQAHKWFNLAASRAETGAFRGLTPDMRDPVAVDMTSAQISGAQRLAGAWRPRQRAASPAPPAPDFALTRQRIARIQRQLASLGYDPGPVDGIMGRKTRAAIRAFQAKMGLPVTGELSEGHSIAIRAAKRTVPSTDLTPQLPMRKRSTGSRFFVSARVASGNDDAEETQSGSISLRSTDLELVNDGTRRPDRTIGMRFLGVDIPRGSKILSAHVQFQVDEMDSGAAALEIRGQAFGSPAAFTNASGDITSRPRTLASIAWSPPPWTSVGAIGADQRTPDVKAIIQEIIELPDWAAGNPMVIIVTGSGERTAESYNGSRSGAPLLHVEFDPTGGVPSNGPLTANFTATPKTGVAPLTVNFDASASVDGAGTVVSYTWDYGDGATGSGAVASHGYNDPGAYTVTLTLTDDGGETATATSTVTAFDLTLAQPLKVAFIGDQGRRSGSTAVLNLIADEGADMVLHQGDFDYVGNPKNWDEKITAILGADFPYFASVGNHDTGAWGGPNGYQAKLIARLGRIPEAICSGDFGVQSACTYRGLFFILSGAGTIPNGSDNASHIAYITDQLAQTNAPMRICSWHKNQTAMNITYKGNEVGWGPYEACREGGAIVATAHSHTYSRTHLLDNFEAKSIADTSDTLVIEKGKSFVFVSGLGGGTIQSRSTSKPWWASIYTSSQGANFGALFCTFFTNGDPTRASCYFKDIDGVVPDQFEIVSAVSSMDSRDRRGDRLGH